MHGLLPFVFNIGMMFSTIFPESSGGVTTTFPARWNLPLLLKGRAVVPSNCSKCTELLPSKSNTKAIESLAFYSTIDTIFLIFSGHGVQPGTVTPTNSQFGSVKWGKLCPRLLAPAYQCYFFSMALG